MLYLNLFKEFFITGLFSFGGGYSTLPFLLHIAEKHAWYSSLDLTKMLAISAITPGPVGVNVATFAGFKTAGLLGAICATFSLALPAFFIVLIVSNLIEKFKSNCFVQSVIEVLMPTAFAMLCFVIISMIKSAQLNPISITLLALLILLGTKNKLQPIFCFLISGLAGVIIMTINQ